MELQAAEPKPLWWDDVPSTPTRDPLPGDRDADVAVIGGGLTGLWTAYHLAVLDPSVRTVVIERRHVGFGASGRNGGWCHAAYPLGTATLVRDCGRDAARRVLGVLNDVVDEVGRVARSEGIDADYVKGGRIGVARSPLQASRARAEVEAMHALGFGEEDVRLLDADEARERIGASDVHGASFSAHTAALHPGKLVHGLAAACERRGVRIHESTAVAAVGPGTVGTDRGTVRADAVIRATEGYTSGFAGQRRTLLPLVSYMIATEPLPDRVWDSIGLETRATFDEHGPQVVYGQRTADGRLAIGGRGAGYTWASRTSEGIELDDEIHAELARYAKELFPVLADYRVTHRWGGPIGVTRDWRPTVRYDERTGQGVAGGYVGDGVAMAALAGRTLAESILGRTSDLTDLPWVQHRCRSWEPEPLRWLGIRTGFWLTASADRAEKRTGRPSWQAALGNRLRGKSG